MRINKETEKATISGPDICVCKWDVVWGDLSIWICGDIEGTEIVFLVRIRNADAFWKYQVVDIVYHMDN